MKRVGKKREVKESTDYFEISDLNDEALRVYNSLSQYVEERDPNEFPCTAQRAILDLDTLSAKKIWKRLNTLIKSDIFSKEKIEALTLLLSWIDQDVLEYELSDKQPKKEQETKIREVTNLASKLLSKIANADAGYLTLFLSSWAQHSRTEILPVDAFTKKLNPANLRGQLAWFHQKNSNRSQSKPMEDLLIGLASLTAFGSKFKSAGTPVSQVGLQSNKKSPIIHYVVRMDKRLSAIFETRQHLLISHFGSIVFNTELSSDRVKDILKRENMRVDVSSAKSKKSPLR
jgi:hypothetical protein